MQILGHRELRELPIEFRGHEHRALERRVGASDDTASRAELPVGGVLEAEAHAHGRRELRQQHALRLLRIARERRVGHRPRTALQREQPGRVEDDDIGCVPPAHAHADLGVIHLACAREPSVLGLDILAHLRRRHKLLGSASLTLSRKVELRLVAGLVVLQMDAERPSRHHARTHVRKAHAYERLEQRRLAIVVMASEHDRRRLQRVAVEWQHVYQLRQLALQLRQGHGRRGCRVLRRRDRQRGEERHNGPRRHCQTLF